MSGTLKTESNHMNPLKELLVEELRDLLHAEGQLVAALPKMAAIWYLKATAPRLRPNK